MCNFIAPFFASERKCFNVYQEKSIVLPLGDIILNNFQKLLLVNIAQEVPTRRSSSGGGRRTLSWSTLDNFRATTGRKGEKIAATIVLEIQSLFQQCQQPTMSVLFLQFNQHWDNTNIVHHTFGVEEGNRALGWVWSVHCLMFTIIPGWWWSLSNLIVSALRQNIHRAP